MYVQTHLKAGITTQQVLSNPTTTADLTAQMPAASAPSAVATAPAMATAAPAMATSAASMAQSPIVIKIWWPSN